jgi:hypothetical protein
VRPWRRSWLRPAAPGDQGSDDTSGSAQPTPTRSSSSRRSSSSSSSDDSSASSGPSGSSSGSAESTEQNVPGMGSTGAGPAGSSQPTYQPPTDTEDAGAPPSGRPTPDPDTTAAVQTALRAEYAAVWTYTLITAFLPPTASDLRTQLQRDLDAHRSRRDATIRLLTDYGVTPVGSEAAYRTPDAVTDSRSAQRLAVSAESDAAAAWRSVLSRCNASGLRHTALDGLTDAAVRGAVWAAGLGDVTPVVPEQPGQSSPA